MWSALFWEVTQRTVIIPWRTFRDNLSAPSSRVKKLLRFLTVEEGADWLSRNVRQRITTVRCVTSHKSADNINVTDPYQKGWTPRVTSAMRFVRNGSSVRPGVNSCPYFYWSYYDAVGILDYIASISDSANRCSEMPTYSFWGHPIPLSYKGYLHHSFPLQQGMTKSR